MKNGALAMMFFLSASTVNAADQPPKPTVEQLQRQIHVLTAQLQYWQARALLIEKQRELMEDQATTNAVKLNNR